MALGRQEIEGVTTHMMTNKHLWYASGVEMVLRGIAVGLPL